MNGERDLSELIKSMHPVLMEGIFVFSTVRVDVRKGLHVCPLCEFREVEGITLILQGYEAEEARLEFEFVSRMITLSVHSNLAALGAPFDAHNIPQSSGRTNGMKVYIGHGELDNHLDEARNA